MSPKLMIDSGPIVPLWLSVPIGAVSMFVLAAHLLAFHASRGDPLRRRLRMTTTTLMMLTVPLIVYAASIVTPRQPHMFVLSWMFVAWVLLMVLVLAVLDILRTASLHRAEVRTMRAHLRAMLATSDPADRHSTPEQDAARRE